MSEYLKWLGMRVRDVLTDFKGVVVSISFDVSGCVQALVYPPHEGKDTPEARWFDTKRLKTDESSPIMERPEFASVAGPVDKPIQ